MTPASLRDIALFQGLSAAELKALQGVLRERHYAKGEIIAAEGSPCERIFVMRSGRVKLYRMTSAGREQVLEMLGPGDTCACNPGNVCWFCSSTAEAVTACSLWLLPREVYIRLVQDNPTMSRSLNQVLACRVQKFSSLIEEVALKDMRQRLVKFLLDQPVENSDSGGELLRMSCTREELARLLGAVRETVTRHLQQLARQGVIALKPRQIRILDRKKLAALLEKH